MECCFIVGQDADIAIGRSLNGHLSLGALGPVVEVTTFSGVEP